MVDSIVIENDGMFTETTYESVEDVTALSKDVYKRQVDSLVAPLSVINALIVALCMKKQSIVAKTLTELCLLYTSRCV